MRHGKKFNKLGRKASHRKAMLSNMACSLITEKRIFTTLAKAKELRKFVEPLITRAKKPTMHNTRIVYARLQNNKAVVQELFERIGPKVADRPGGYTRILRTGKRLGDNADMCMIELVDYNEAMLEGDTTKTRRSRRKKKSSENQAETPAAETTKEVLDAPEADASSDEESKEEKND